MLLPVPVSVPTTSHHARRGWAGPAGSLLSTLLASAPPRQSSLHLQPGRCCGTLGQITPALCSGPSGSSTILTVGTGPRGPGLYCLTDLSAHPVPAPSASSLLLKRTSPSAAPGALAVSSARIPPPPDVPRPPPSPPSGLHLHPQGRLPDHHSSTQPLSCPSFIVGWPKCSSGFSYKM